MYIPEQKLNGLYDEWNYNTNPHRAPEHGFHDAWGKKPDDRTKRDKSLMTYVSISTNNANGPPTGIRVYKSAVVRATTNRVIILSWMQFPIQAIVPQVQLYVCMMHLKEWKTPAFLSKFGIDDHSCSSFNTYLFFFFIQCVPIKRKPVISVTEDLIKLYASLSRAYSLLSVDTKHMMISQCMTEKEQFKLIHVKSDLRRIMVLSWYDKV